MGLRPFPYGPPPSLKPALRAALSFWECPRLGQVPAEEFRPIEQTLPADQMTHEHSKVDFSKTEEVTEQTIYDQLFTLREQGLSENDLLVHVSGIILQQRQEIERAREEIPHGAAQEQIKQVQDAHERGILKGRDDLMREFRQAIYAKLPGGQQLLDRMGYFVTPSEGVEKLYKVLHDGVSNAILELTPHSQKEAVRRRLEGALSHRAKIAAYCNLIEAERLEIARNLLKQSFPSHCLHLNESRDLTSLIGTGLKIAEGVAIEKAQTTADLKLFNRLRTSVESFVFGTPVKVPDVNNVQVMAQAIYNAGKHDGEEHFKRDKLRPIDVTWKKVVKTLLTCALETSQSESREVYDAVDQIQVGASSGTYTAAKDLVRKIASEKAGARIKQFAQVREQRDALAKAVAQLSNGYFFAVDIHRDEARDRLAGKIRLQAPTTPRSSFFEARDWEFDKISFSEAGLPVVHVVQRR